MASGSSLSEAKRRLLQSYLHGGRAPTFPAPRLITPRCSDEPAPLSLSQEQLLLRERSMPGIPPLYNECITLRMSGPLDVCVLKRSLTEIIRRHEIWRTTYEVVDGTPVQVIHPAPALFELPILDLQGISRPAQEIEAVRQVTPSATRPFDLRRGPLV